MFPGKKPENMPRFYIKTLRHLRAESSVLNLVKPRRFYWRNNCIPPLNPAFQHMLRCHYPPGGDTIELCEKAHLRVILKESVADKIGKTSKHK